MAFVKTSTERNAELEAQLAELEAANAVPPEDDKNLSVEEKNFKKRYSDLRSHASKLENQLRDEINQLKGQLTVATKKTMDFPKTAEEVQAWAAKYPEIYDTIVTIARQNAIDVQKDVQETVQNIQNQAHENAKAKAYFELCSEHKDFPDIATDQDFIDWVEAQPKYIYDALYVNETDSASAIRAVDLYKSDRGISKTKTVEKKEKPDTRRETAQRTPSGQTTNVNTGDLKWTESKVASKKWSKLTDA